MPAPPNPAANAVWIDTPEALADICNAFASAEWLTVDTEFFREHSYYPELCLVQIADTERVALIDPLALPDLEPLRALLFRVGITKVLHAASQDVEIFHMLWGAVPAPLFDTQIAAALAGHGDQIGYAALVAAITGVQLDKAQSRTDWKRRPLSQAQRDYAAADVTHLRDVYLRLHAELASNGRLAWLDDDFNALADGTRFAIDDANAWRRIKGSERLRPRQLALLQVLAAWREGHARERNLPRQHVLKDTLLLDLARLRPQNMNDLRGLRGLAENVLRRDGDALLALLRADPGPPPQHSETVRKGAASPNQAALLDILNAALRIIANDTGISTGALAGRRDLEALIAAEAEASLLHGWRWRIAGETLQKVLHGELALGVRDGRAGLFERLY